MSKPSPAEPDPDKEFARLLAESNAREQNVQGAENTAIIVASFYNTLIGCGVDVDASINLTLAWMEHAFYAQHNTDADDTDSGGEDA